MSWATLFERAGEHGASLDDVRAALARQREADDESENERNAHDAEGADEP